MARPYKIKRHKRIYRRSAGSILARVAAIVAAVAVLFGLGWALYGPVSDWISQKQKEPTQQQEMVPGASASEPAAQPQQQEPAPPAAEPEQPSELTSSKTAYLNNQTVADPQAFSQALQQAVEQGYDSILFDLKSQDGTVHYTIDYNEPVNARVTAEHPIDLQQTAQQILDAGLMPVASIYTFHDNIYPLADNSASTYYMDSDVLWVDDAPDKGGKPWIDPFTQSGQDYIRHIIDDAIEAGFQKIILQEVQFPEGYSLDMIDYGTHASDDKHAFLAQYIEQMTAYAAQQGVELSAMFPSSRLLGANTAMYFGDPAALVGERAVADLRIQSFGSGFTTEAVSIPNPSDNPENTLQTASAALVQKMGDCQLTAVIDGEGLTQEQLNARIRLLEQNGISACIVASPALS
ncbi:MAG: putative glycoside hydrolase [Negativibacillus sp.]|nr:putative glycoside hydrolase [Negativibacillus sp.]